jgi:hypothetical protein
MKALFTIIIISLGFVSVAFSQTTNDFRKASWAFVGYASPDSALESWTWALAAGNKKVMLQSLTPEAQKEWQRQLAGLTDEQLKAQAAQGAAKQARYTIRKRQVVSDVEVVINILMIGSDEVVGMDEKKIGSEWKVAGEKKIELYAAA